jgi:hypothetical protein
MISTMCGKRVTLLFLLLPALSALLMSRAWSRAPAGNDQAQPLSQQQMQELIRNAADHDLENDQKQRDYTYTQREEERRLDGRGQVKSVETKTSEIMELYGEQVARLVAKDDKPLSAKDAAKEEQKLQKLIDQRKNESAENRRKREDKEKKEREQDREFVGEVSDAYNFHLVGLATLEGRPTYMVDAEPRPGYEPHLKGAKLLPKFRFRVWIDQQESQWKKLDIQCIDTVSFGLILARVHKGSRIVIEQTRVNDEVWLPQHVALKADVRVGLLKEFNVESDFSYSNYRKFHSDTKVIVGAEVPQPQ